MNMNDFLSKIRWQLADAPTGNPPAAPVAPAAPAAPAAAPTAPDLSFIPADYVVNGAPDLARFGADYQAMVAERAQRAEQMGQIPEKYEFKLPADFKVEGVPEGWSFNLDQETFAPLFDEAGSLLKEIGAPAPAAEKLMGLLGKYEAQKEAADYAAWEADIKQLGTQAQIDARMGNVQRKLETMLPKEQVAALFSGARITADGIRALEKILTPSGFQAPTPTLGGVDTEAMTPSQRLEYANKQQAQKRA